MRRKGYIIEEIVERSNMEDSFDYVMRKKKHKRSRTGRLLLKNREQVIDELSMSITSGTFNISGYREYEICERGKVRKIQCIRLKERIALNAIMRGDEKHLNRRFIADSAASIKGRGGLYLLKRMLRDMYRDQEGTSCVYKCDIRKFYQSVSQDAMMFVVRRFFKDKKLISLLENFVRMLPDGISIGLRSSQALGNLLLNYYIDHVIKDNMSEKYFRRYCDDMVIQRCEVKDLQPAIEAIHKGAAMAGLQIKENEQVFNVNDRGIDFLGYVSYFDHIRVRKHIKQRFARRWNKVESKRRKQELLASFYGIAKHADANHLFKTITGIGMKDFKSLNVAYRPSDGKKRFSGAMTPLGDLQNCEIVVLDYETDIKTKQGDGRYVIQYEQNGQKGKFITNSEEMKSILDQIREAGELPFKAVIKREVFGQNKIKYNFS
ncbi:MAG: reverse transcriptase domain-containing protein [Massilibacteroides sp.]|nr:reverse transcriptase domain-containing protein [Massilibacteroides sp.]